MNTINPCYLTKKIKNFMRDIIRDIIVDTEKDPRYHKMHFIDKCELASYLIEASGREHENEFLLESNHIDQIVGSFRKSLFGRGNDEEKFILCMKENVVEYFDETMEALFEYVIEEMESEGPDYFNNEDC